MSWEHSTRIMQFVVAALAIPATGGGAYSVYRTYFSTEVACQNLRTGIVSIMERNVAPDAKRALLRKDVAEFEKQCGELDPDARELFLASVQEPSPALASATPMTATMAKFKAAPGTAAAAAAPSDGRGWVNMGKRNGTNYADVNFDGFAFAGGSLPPAGTVMKTRWPVPVFKDLPMAAADQNQKLGTLRAGTCVRVLATQVGPARMWAQVTLATCS